MQAKIDTLKFKNNNNEEYIVYPRTLIRCVTNEHGDNLEDKIKDTILASDGAIYVDYGNREVTENFVPIDANTLEGHNAEYFATAEALSEAATAAETYADTAITNLVNGAPETLDTLKELADTMKENEDVVTALDEAIGTKANQSELDTHTSNNTIHITADERTAWNNKANAADLANYLPLTGGTLSGNLNVSGGDFTIRKTNNGRADFYKNHSDTADYGLTIKDVNANEENVALYLKANTDKVEFRNKAGDTYEILHTGNSTADKVKAGTFGGKVMANLTAQATLDTAQLRNIYIGTVTEGATSSLPEGTIVFSKE